MRASRIVSILVCILFCSEMFGQDILNDMAKKQGSDEISLSYGRISVPGIAMVTGGVLGVMFTGGAAKPDKIGSSGAIGLEYYHFFNDNFGVGGAATFENCMLHFSTSSDSDSNQPFISVMPGVKYRWFNREHVGMYTKANVGAMYMPSADSAWSFAFQASPFGIEAGSPNIRGFAEIGFGTQGMVLIGIKFKL